MLHLLKQYNRWNDTFSGSLSSLYRNMLCDFVKRTIMFCRRSISSADTLLLGHYRYIIPNYIGTNGIQPLQTVQTLFPSVYRSGQYQLLWIINRYSPFFVSIFQIRGREAEFKLSHIFGVIDASRKHLRQISCESGQALRQMSIKTLVRKGQKQNKKTGLK